MLILWQNNWKKKSDLGNDFFFFFQKDYFLHFLKWFAMSQRGLLVYDVLYFFFVYFVFWCQWVILNYAGKGKRKGPRIIFFNYSLSLRNIKRRSNMFQITVHLLCLNIDI